MAVDFHKVLKLITVLKPATDITIQDLHDEIRLFEEQNPNLEVAKIMNASGKQPLGGGVQVGITLELVNDWRLAFEDRSPGPAEVLCTVSGGNLVATNIYNNNPIYPTPYVQVVIAQSSSATILSPASDYGLLYLVESLRGRPASVGDIWYWDPTSGSDTNNGTTPVTAVATFAQAQTLASTGTPDNIIFALASAGGVTTVTEKITISNPNIKLRGPGYTFQFAPDSAGAPTVSITADNVEFSGFYVTTFTGGTDNGVTVTGDNSLIKDVWVKSATGNGIGVSSSARTTVDTCAIEDCVGNGIAIGASTAIAKVRQCVISGNTGDGVDLSGASVTDNILENNLIFNNTGWGIDVNASATRTGIRLHHTIAKNTAGNIEDGGTDTFQDTSGAVTGGDIDAIVDGVWDELISAHTGTGSTGKTLKDAKVKATLAAIKP
ncbi:hypothetical protein A2797_01765 [candidate division WWE3 bacterium RIFCSPHIGHO2_01_FULL_48_15]|uniref:Right handed beta helix domain-containing protein n=1 Tax=candidate division WWE3 bacterium RIFCSPHIGHO2_01_FULL_48_15 TaxID=1802619 RepID=A0A1F4VD44_UNCKA|nr:MAG: hypothetical protein A2797_01765 [candidate division WWE3 bacterium RIFCSPHIGHO2_01_FULL_48_15]